MLRTGNTTAIAPRGFARCKAAAITVRSAISAPPSFRKLHCGGRKQPNSLVRPSWSDTAAAGCGQVCRARPCCHRVAAHALRSAVVESENWHRAGATTPGGRDAVTPAKVLPALRRVGMREQPTLRFSLQVFAARLGVGFASGTFTQHTLSVWSGKNLPPKFFSCRQLPASGNPSARNLGQTMWRCVQSRRCTGTLTATRIPHPARHRPWRGSHRASWRASLMPTPPRRWLSHWAGSALSQEKIRSQKKQGTQGSHQPAGKQE